MNEDCKLYWNETADLYQDVTRINTDDFHYGPLLPGEKELQLLPNLENKRCLEIGSGAAQNSFYLKSIGAGECVALDISEEQLEHAKKIGEKLNQQVETVCAPIDEMPVDKMGKFDFIHSTWAFPFSQDQGRVVKQCADMLNEGGQLMITTGHPVFAGEWIILDEYEQGMFLTSYFNPPADVRFTEDEENFIRAEQVPIGTFIDYLLDAGLTIKRVLEPKPIELETLTEEQILTATPYDSPAWRELYQQIKSVPFVVTYIAEKR